MNSFERSSLIPPEKKPPGPEEGINYCYIFNE